MAEEQSEQKEKTQPVTIDTAQLKGSKLFKYLAVIQSILLLAAISGYFLWLRPKTTPEVVTLESNSAGGEEPTPESSEEESELLEGEKLLGAIYPLDTFVVNLRDKGFLKIKIQLEFTSRDIPSRFFSREVLVRDSLVTLLSAKLRDDVTSTAGKDKLKDEIKEVINTIMHKHMLEKIFFTEFIVH